MEAQMGQHVVGRRSRSGPRQRTLEAVAQDILDSEGDGRSAGAFIARGAPCTLSMGPGRGFEATMGGGCHEVARRRERAPKCLRLSPSKISRYLE